jgi:hypothetical protein
METLHRVPVVGIGMFISQYRLRAELKVQNETLPNQINKPIQNPAHSWIFQIMEGIGVIRFYEKLT